MKIVTTSRPALAGIAISSLFGLPGCGPYTAAPQRYSESWSGFRVDLPEGWLHCTQDKTGYTITRDGLRLEKITTRVTRIGEKLEGTDRVYNPGMLPHEAAELTVGLLRTSKGASRFEVEHIDTARIGGQDGYRIDAVYVDESGLRKRMRVYGVILGKYVCELVYDAAEPIYFQKHEAEFQAMVSSARVSR